MWASGDSITNSQDTIDSRDIISRIEELEAERETLVDAVTEAQAAVDLAHDDNSQTDDEVEAASEGPGCDLDNAVEELHSAEEELSDWDGYEDCGLELAKLKEFAEEVESQGCDNRVGGWGVLHPG